MGQAPAGPAAPPHRARSGPHADQTRTGSSGHEGSPSRRISEKRSPGSIARSTSHDPSRKRSRKTPLSPPPCRGSSTTASLAGISATTRDRLAALRHTRRRGGGQHDAPGDQQHQPSAVTGLAVPAQEQLSCGAPPVPVEQLVEAVLLDGGALAPGLVPLGPGRLTPFGAVRPRLSPPPRREQTADRCGERLEEEVGEEDADHAREDDQRDQGVHERLDQRNPAGPQRPLPGGGPDLLRWPWNPGGEPAPVTDHRPCTQQALGGLPFLLLEHCGFPPVILVQGKA